jgi:hypothetical protein
VIDCDRLAANTSYHPPEPPKDHWGRDTALPKFEKAYTLKLIAGIVHVLDDDGKLQKDVADYYMGMEEFLADSDRLTYLIGDGPLYVP